MMVTRKMRYSVTVITDAEYLVGKFVSMGDAHIFCNQAYLGGTTYRIYRGDGKIMAEYKLTITIRGEE